MKKLLLAMLAPLCFTAACATTPDATDDTTDTATDTAALTQSDIGPVKTDGASCTIFLPVGWSGRGAQCRSGGHGTGTIFDGTSDSFESVGAGVGNCTVTCHNGVLTMNGCTCRPDN